MKCNLHESSSPGGGDRAPGPSSELQGQGCGSSKIDCSKIIPRRATEKTTKNVVGEIIKEFKYHLGNTYMATKKAVVMRQGNQKT